MNRARSAGGVLALTLAYCVGRAHGLGSFAANHSAAGAARSTAPGSSQAPGGALPPSEYSKITLAPDQGNPVHFSGADLRTYHTELQARAAKGNRLALSSLSPRNLMKNIVTRTHSYILVHRAESHANQPTDAEQHEGNTDVYFVVAGSGTVVVGGDIEDRRTIMPGEYGGRLKGGARFTVQAGDILNIPPNTPHGTLGDAGGMTYVLMKVNVGLYPWFLINGTP
jgi:mannose-6-phosphate isomerase-like protein (cupin superfamily)